MRFCWIAATALLATVLSAFAEGPGGTPAIEIRSTPVEITGGVLDGLALHGTTELDSDHPEFGGFSGLNMQDGHLIAVSDAGWWLLADVEDTATGLKPTNSGFAPMRDSEGARFEKAGGDAEGLTVRDGNLVVSFVRDHRIAFHIETGQVGDDVRHNSFEAMSSNKGLEALATTPDGWIIAIGEKPAAKGFPVFLLRYSGDIDRAFLSKTSRHFVTGADVGPDGRLYLLKRDFSILLGVSILIERYDLDEEGYPLAETRKQLARFDGDSGIDNMEGISLWMDGQGATRLTLISDDNFNSFQRTLLMDFTVLAEVGE